MKCLRFVAPVGAACLIVTQSSSGLAWGWQGHEYVGALAWPVLNRNAKSHVTQLLGPGVSLSLATLWADCAKTVTGPPDFEFTKKFTPAECHKYSAAERQRMYDYVHRNWNNCRYSHELRDCHKSFHFADVNVHEHSDYSVTYFGAGPNDVVQAIKAATIALKCKTDWASCAIPEPFHLASKREALLLLSHFVGDLHQPLHVGAVYLDDEARETGDSGAETIGGNALFVTPGGENLHHLWDTVPDAPPTEAAIEQACLISPLPNPTTQPPEAWASESVAAAREAYSGMTFVKNQPPAEGWTILFADKPEYLSDTKRVQAIQRIKAGARLAALLNSIWPSTKVATKCK